MFIKYFISAVISCAFVFGLMSYVPISVAASQRIGTGHVDRKTGVISIHQKGQGLVAKLVPAKNKKSGKTYYKLIVPKQPQ